MSTIPTAFGLPSRSLRNSRRCRSFRIVLAVLLVIAPAHLRREPGRVGAAELATAVVTEAELNSAVETIRASELRRAISFLASDTLEGREAGSRGGRAASTYLIEQLETLKLVPGGEGKFSQPFDPNYRNLLAILPGSDPELSAEYIVIGAHYDHIGYGYSGNARGRPGGIHNGADDNASGTATVLEIAKAMSALPVAPRRSILFALWDAEELGLLGSKHWIAHPTRPLDRVRFYLNLDMVGRLNGNILEVYGSRTAPGLREVYARNNRMGVGAAFSWDIIPDSDHYPFVQKRIPFLMPFTGKHEDYHLPSDDADKIRYDDTERIARHWFLIAWDLANQDALPEFRAQALNEHEGQRRQIEQAAPPLKSRLGITWNGTESEARRQLIVRGVSEGSPAAAAGLRPGDAIESINGEPFEETNAFLRTLSASSPDALLMVRKREDPREPPVPVSVRLSGDPVRVGLSWFADPVEPGILIVNQVILGSPADAAGLSPRDRLTRVVGPGIESSGVTPQQVFERSTTIDVEYERKGIPGRTRIEPLRVSAPPLSAPRPAAVNPEPESSAATAR